MSKETLVGLDASLSVHGQVAEICKPIFELFGITFFRYVRVFLDGSRIDLGTSQEWTEHFYSRGRYHLSWLDSHPNRLAKKNETIWDEKALRDDNIVGVEARQYFNMHHGISIVRPGDQYCELIDFATDKENVMVNDIYVNHFDVFERFIFYFREKASYLISAVESNRILPQELMEDWVSRDVRWGHADETLSKFLEETKINRYFINVENGSIYLTKKEAECIYWTVLGKSADEIAVILGSARRTVEVHLDNAKQKFSCSKISLVLEKVISSGLFEVLKLDFDERALCI